MSEQITRTGARGLLTWLLAALLGSGCVTHSLVLSSAASTAAPIHRAVSSQLDVRPECPSGVARIDVSQNALAKVVTLGFKDVVSLRIWCAAATTASATPSRNIIIVPGN